MKKEKIIKLFISILFTCFVLSKELKAQGKSNAQEFIAYGYLCASTDTSAFSSGKLYSIQKFDAKCKLISRIVLGKQNDTVESYSYDNMGRLVKELYEEKLSFYYYSGISLAPDSCIITSFIKEKFPFKESGRFNSTQPDSLKSADAVKNYDKAVQAFISTSHFSNNADKKILINYMSKEKIARKDEYSMNQKIKEELKLREVTQFNKKDQLVRFERQVFDYGGYSSTYEDFFYNKLGKLTHAFGYYDKKTKDKPDYIICYRYIQLK
ncbi:MAG: hypothetical protein JWP12_3236 [Bacteroidetes bacterium]|nr:hypothetical protein [Bacteroidota bacterium]